MGTTTTRQVIKIAQNSLETHRPGYKFQDWAARFPDKFSDMFQLTEKFNNWNTYSWRSKQCFWVNGGWQPHELSKPDTTLHELTTVARHLFYNLAEAKNTVALPLLQYTYFKPYGKDYVVVRAGKKIRTLNQLTKLPGLQESGLLSRPPFGREFVFKYVKPDKKAEFKEATKLMFNLVDATFLQGILSGGKPLDLSRGLLPDSDEKFRVSNVHMLYDSYDKEWRLWVKN